MKKLLSMLLAATLSIGLLAIPVSAAPMKTEQGTAAVVFDSALQDRLSDLALQTIENQSQKHRTRTIITTDGEVDDMDSFLRMLLYANEFDIIGIIYSSSRYHYEGYGEGAERTPAFRWLGTLWIDYYLDRYEEVYDKLVQHDPNYPTAEYLRSLIRIGNIENVGDVTTDTEGSNYIRDILLDDAEEEVYVQIWGGTNTFARALISIQEEYEDTAEWDSIVEKVCDKTSVYMVLSQDNTYDTYVRPNWPGIKLINNSGVFWSFAYQHTSRVSSDVREKYFRESFFKDQIMDIGSPLLSEYMTMGDGHDLVNIGTLGSAHKFGADVSPEYPYADEWGEQPNEDRGSSVRNGYKMYDFISEGDSVSFFQIIDNGLRSLEDPSYGGWGGRFEQDPQISGTYNDSAYDTNASGSRDKNYTLTRWFPDIQEDFAARAQWTIKNYDEANHAPMNGVLNGLDIAAVPGETVTLNGVAYDPDGDSLTYTWWQYQEAGSYNGAVNLQDADTDTASFTVPLDADVGDTIHIIFEAQDDAEQPMKAYKRVILTVTDEVESDKVLITIEGDDNAVQGEDVAYTIFAGNTDRLATATIWFEVDGNLLTGTKFEGCNGFEKVGDVAWQDMGNGIWGARVTLANMSGGITGKDFQEIFHMTYASSAEKTGEAYVKITGVELSGYDANNIAIFNEYEIVKDTHVTEFVQWYSIYDVNRDGSVDQLDLTTAQLYYRLTSDDAEWGEMAERADVNSDGRVDIEDLILILNNIIW